MSKEGKELNDAKIKSGTIIRSYSDWFDVLTPDGVFACQLRGRFRKTGRALTGDRVRISTHDDGTGVIEEIEERSNQLLRPRIANVDQGVMVMSLAQPDLNLPLLDRALVLMEHEGLEVLICFNKVDLVPEEEACEATELYARAGYPVLISSTKMGVGIETLREKLTGMISVLAGPSGGGKSSLLNAVRPGLRLNVAPVSKATGRGRHTTRQVELLEVSEGALVADTPGFSRLELGFLSKWDISEYFREMAQLRQECRFPDCLHRREPDCRVKQAVKQGEVAESRYKNYLMLVEECEEMERRKYS